MSLPLRGKGDRYPLWVVVDEVFFGICNILLKYTSSTNRRRFRRKLVRNAKHFEYTSSVTRFYCLTQFFIFVVRATFPLRGRHNVN